MMDTLLAVQCKFTFHTKTTRSSVDLPNVDNLLYMCVLLAFREVPPRTGVGGCRGSVCAERVKWYPNCAWRFQLVAVPPARHVVNVLSFSLA